MPVQWISFTPVTCWRWRPATTVRPGCAPRRGPGPCPSSGGWPSAGGEQACRYDGPRLQFPAGHAHRGRSLAWQRGADFVFHPVNRLDKGTTGLMVVAKSGYIHDRLRYALHTERFCREYRAVCIAVRIRNPAPSTPPSAGTRILWWAGASGLTVPGPSPIMRCWGGRTACPPAAAAGDRADPSAPGAHGLHRLPPGRGLAVRGRGPGPDPPAGPPRLRSGSGPSGDGRASVPDGAHPGGHGPAGAGAFDGNRVRK